jgi:two-component system, sensor histidine kinase and response regulator
MKNNFKSTILIVDDEAGGRQTLESLLANENYNLIFAEEGFEAIAKALESKPDLILLDVMMPGIDGFEVCRIIRKNNTLFEIPIILITALDDKGSRMNGIKSGADDFVSKPIDSRELRLRIKTIIRLDRFRQIHRGLEERLRLEKELEKEKEMNALKSAFVSMASHEFRTPLATISFATGFLKKYRQKLNEHEIDKKLTNIEIQVKHMIGLLEDMLALGKSESQQTLINKSTFSFISYIEPIIEQVNFVMNYKNEFKINQLTESCKIFIDPEIGKNVFVNLLSNASKFSNEKSIVTINISNTDSEAIVEIEDQGIGIENKELNSIFNAFQRGSNVGNIQGTGLGLAIVKRALERLGGSIKMESEIGKGTKVTVSLPFNE